LQRIFLGSKWNNKGYVYFLLGIKEGISLFQT